MPRWRCWRDASPWLRRPWRGFPGMAGGLAHPNVFVVDILAASLHLHAALAARAAPTLCPAG